MDILSAGNKAASSLKRLYGDRISGSYEELQKEPFNFTTASYLAQQLDSRDADRAAVSANKFKSMIAYDTEMIEVLTKKGAKSLDKAEWSKVVDQYEFEPASGEVWDDLHEW